MIQIEAVFLIIIGVILFEMIVFLHEGGHFVTAKLSGVKVNEFALGMGPKLLKFKKGETLYSLRLFPIGGFCSMEGEDEESEDERSFNKKPVWKRMIIVVAGAVMNILFGFVLLLILLAPNQYFASTTIASFAENSTSIEQLEVDDEIISINGYGISTSMDLSFAMATAKSNELDISVRRSDGVHNYQAVKFPTVKKDDGTEIIQLDFRVKAIENNFLALMKQTFLSTVSTVRMVWAGLYGLITGQFSFNEVAGPIGMTTAVAQATEKGLESSFLDGLSNLVYVMMIITVNLGVVNLLPLPALDGGRLVFLIIEAIRRKPLKSEVEAYIHGIGMILLLLFMVVVSVKDVIQLIF